MTNRNAFTVPAMLAFMFVATSALAQGVAAPPAVTGMPVKAAKPAVDPRVDPQAIVCKREDTTGTRLGVTRVCHTRAEWAAEAVYSKESAQHLQDSVSYH